MSGSSTGNVRRARRRIASLWHSGAGRFFLRVLLYGGALFVGLPVAFSFALTRPHRSASSERPARGYEEVTLRSDELQLRAWLARGRVERAAVVLVHGLGDNLESYVEHARPFVARGHTVLLPDLRGHGGSEGRLTTLGGREAEDVRAAMRFLRKAGLAGDGVVLMGTSMGAVAVILAAAEENDVRAVVAEAPFDSYRDTVAHHARLFYGLPAWVPLIPLTVGFAEWRADFDADDIDAVAAAGRIRAPLLAIVDGNDERMPETVVRRIIDAHGGPNQLWVASGVGHAGAILHPDWERTVLEFLGAAGIELGVR